MQISRVSFFLFFFILLGNSLVYAETYSESVLKDILAQAKFYKSDRVIVIQNGTEILNYSSNNKNTPIEAMSATKSIVGLAIGIAITEGKIASLDVPVSSFFPTWKGTDKASITLRQLLNHTSGLQADSNTQSIYKSKDFVKFALEAPLATKPGSAFFYNNRAVNLLPEIIQRATKTRLDKYLKEKLFAKLGIQNSEWSWSLDGSGNPHGMAGLQISAEGLAKIGQLILQQGIWDSQQIITKSYLEEMLMAGQPFENSCGLLWWRKSDFNEDKLYYDNELLKKYQDSKALETYLPHLNTIKDEKLFRQDWYKKLVAMFGSEKEFQNFVELARGQDLPFAKIERGPVRYYCAEGYLGQYLVVIPQKGIIGVRQIRQTSAGPNSDFPTFGVLLSNL